MKIRRCFRTIPVVLLGACVFFFVSCEGKGVFSQDGAGSTEGGSANKASIQPWKTSSSARILAVLGQDYASNSEILLPLLDEYGSEADGGSVSVLRYPESFKVDGIVRISRLAEVAAEKKVDMLVSVGIPEGSVNTLKKAADSNPSLKVLTILPDEDSLAMEALSDLVLTPYMSVDMLDEEKAAVLSESDIGILLLSAVMAMQNVSGSATLTGGSIVPVKSLESSVTAILKRSGVKTPEQAWTFTAYTDPDTGLKARNHLVFKRPDSGGRQ